MTSRVVTTVFAALLSHIGLSVPSPNETAVEGAVSRSTAPFRGLGVGSWNLWVVRFVILSSAALDVGCVYALYDPTSAWSPKILAWVPSVVLNYFKLPESSGTSLPRLVGLTLILSGAFLNISSRLSLGELTRFPVIPAPKRILYIPPSQLPSTSPSDSQRKSDNGKPSLDDKKLWTLRPSHRLVTSGPFAYIRHPMYSGVALTLVGLGLQFVSKGSLPEYVVQQFLGPRHTSIPWMMLAVGGLRTAVDLGTLARREDAALENSFDKLWTYYRWNVPFRFLPGIY